MSISQLIYEKELQMGSFTPGKLAFSRGSRSKVLCLNHTKKSPHSTSGNVCKEEYIHTSVEQV